MTENLSFRAIFRAVSERNLYFAYRSWEGHESKDEDIEDEIIEPIPTPCHVCGKDMIKKKPPEGEYVTIIKEKEYRPWICGYGAFHTYKKTQKYKCSRCGIMLKKDSQVCGRCGLKQ